ncbi:hypothetical protein Cadr_000022875 [Camelus dromedarius]|uniref:Uncharacterized protein n=1 Tax=Camelus dromedarius TaxID=9838 RepID=A0A5N4CG45_CAMDR|nr:hypothetical protein Cadr_000022875 [Camelus dromedarius]
MAQGSRGWVLGGGQSLMGMEFQSGKMEDLCGCGPEKGLLGGAGWPPGVPLRVFHCSLISSRAGTKSQLSQGPQTVFYSPGRAQILGSRAVEETRSPGAALESRPPAKREVPNNSPQEASPLPDLHLYRQRRLPLREVIPEGGLPLGQAGGGAGKDRQEEGSPGPPWPWLPRPQQWPPPLATKDSSVSMKHQFFEPGREHALDSQPPILMLHGREPWSLVPSLHSCASRLCHPRPPPRPRPALMVVINRPLPRSESMTSLSQEADEDRHVSFAVAKARWDLAASLAFKVTAQEGARWRWTRVGPQPPPGRAFPREPARRRHSPQGHRQAGPEGKTNVDLGILLPREGMQGGAGATPQQWSHLPPWKPEEGEGLPSVTGVREEPWGGRAELAGGEGAGGGGSEHLHRLGDEETGEVQAAAARPGPLKELVTVCVAVGGDPGEGVFLPPIPRAWGVLPRGEWNKARRRSQESPGEQGREGECAERAQESTNEGGQSGKGRTEWARLPAQLQGGGAEPALRCTPTPGAHGLAAQTGVRSGGQPCRAGSHLSGVGVGSLLGEGRLSPSPTPAGAEQPLLLLCLPSPHPTCPQVHKAGSDHFPHAACEDEAEMRERQRWRQRERHGAAGWGARPRALAGSTAAHTPPAGLSPACAACGSLLRWLWNRMLHRHRGPLPGDQPTSKGRDTALFPAPSCLWENHEERGGQGTRLGKQEGGEQQLRRALTAGRRLSSCGRALGESEPASSARPAWRGSDLSESAVCGRRSEQGGGGEVAQASQPFGACLFAPKPTTSLFPARRPAERNLTFMAPSLAKAPSKALYLFLDSFCPRGPPPQTVKAAGPTHPGSLPPTPPPAPPGAAHRAHTASGVNASLDFQSSDHPPSQPSSPSTKLGFQNSVGKGVGQPQPLGFNAERGKGPGWAWGVGQWPGGPQGVCSFTMAAITKDHKRGSLKQRTAPPRKALGESVSSLVQLLSVPCLAAASLQPLPAVSHVMVPVCPHVPSLLLIRTQWQQRRLQQILWGSTTQLTTGGSDPIELSWPYPYKRGRHTRVFSSSLFLQTTPHPCEHTAGRWLPHQKPNPAETLILDFSSLQSHEKGMRVFQAARAPAFLLRQPAARAKRSREELRSSSPAAEEALPAGARAAQLHQELRLQGRAGCCSRLTGALVGQGGGRGPGPARCSDPCVLETGSVLRTMSRMLSSALTEGSPLCLSSMTSLLTSWLTRVTGSAPSATSNYTSTAKFTSLVPKVALPAPVTGFSRRPLHFILPPPYPCPKTALSPPPLIPRPLTPGFHLAMGSWLLGPLSLEGSGWLPYPLLAPRSGPHQTFLQLHTQDPPEPWALASLWVGWGDAGELKLQGHSQSPAPNLDVGPLRCSSQSGPLVWRHREPEVHTQEHGSPSDVLSSILHKKLIEPQEPAPSPHSCPISLRQLKQDSGLEKGERLDFNIPSLPDPARVGPHLVQALLPTCCLDPLAKVRSSPSGAGRPATAPSHLTGPSTWYMFRKKTVVGTKGRRMETQAPEAGGHEHVDWATFGGFGLTDGLLSGLADSSLAPFSVVTELPQQSISPRLLEHSPRALASGGGKTVCGESQGGVDCGRESLWAPVPCGDGGWEQGRCPGGLWTRRDGWGRRASWDLSSTGRWGEGIRRRAFCCPSFDSRFLPLSPASMEVPAQCSPSPLSPCLEKAGSAGLHHRSAAGVPLPLPGRHEQEGGWWSPEGLVWGGAGEQVRVRSALPPGLVSLYSSAHWVPQAAPGTGTRTGHRKSGRLREGQEPLDFGPGFSRAVLPCRLPSTPRLGVTRCPSVSSGDSCCLQPAQSFSFLMPGFLYLLLTPASSWLISLLPLLPLLPQGFLLCSLSMSAPAICVDRQPRKGRAYRHHASQHLAFPQHPCPPHLSTFACGLPSVCHLSSDATSSMDQQGRCEDRSRRWRDAFGRRVKGGISWKAKETDSPLEPPEEISSANTLISDPGTHIRHLTARSTTQSDPVLLHSPQRLLPATKPLYCPVRHRIP